MPTHEREITAPVDLCRPDGTLDPDAVGWSRTPLHRGNLGGRWGRRKQWEYWGVVTPDHLVGLVASSLDYAGVHSIWVRDRRTGQEWSKEATVPFARGSVFPDRSGVGLATTGGHGGLQIDLHQSPAGTTIRATAPGITIDLEVPLPPGHECLGVVVPWSERRYQYTVKDVSRPVTGRLVLDGHTHEVLPGTAWAVLDHGRGRWPYRIRWNWAAGSGPDGRGIQLGDKWTTGTGSTENALLLDGRIHKIGEELHWDYDRADWLRPWRITGEQADITFTPWHDKVSRTELGLLGNRTHQCFGEFSGWAAGDDGQHVSVDGLVGWAEEADNRW